MASPRPGSCREVSCKIHPPMAHDVFISYAEPDRKVADAACHALEAAGIRCWVAPRDVPSGSQYGQAIIAGIEGCRLLVLIFSSRANHSDFVAREVERAASKRKVILPFRIEDVPPGAALELFIAERHWLDALTPPLEARLAELVAATKGILTGTPADPPPRPVARTVRRSYRLAVAAAIVVAAGGIWSVYNFFRPPPGLTVAGSDVALAAITQRIRHLDRRLIQVKENFSHERVGRDAKPPGGIVGDIATRTYREGVLVVRAEGVERLASETPLGPALAEDGRLGLAGLGASAESIEALEDGFRQVDKHTAEFAADLRAGAAEVGRGAVEEARAMDFVLWRVELSGLRIEADALKAHLAYLRILRDLSGREHREAKTAIDNLGTLAVLRPAAPLTEDVERRIEQEIRALDGAIKDIVARLLREAQETLDLEAAKLDAIAREHDDFKVLPNDAPPRVATKAIVARSMGRIETALEIFGEYGRMFEASVPGADRYVEVARAFTLDPERARDGRTGTYIYTVLPESPLHGRIFEGDVIEFFDGRAVAGSGDLIQARDRAAGKEVEIAIFRLEGRQPKRHKIRFMVPPGGSLGVGADRI